MMSTKEIEKTYDITRQTLNNWIQRKIISKPTKKGNKNIWSRTNIIEIERAVSQKNEKNLFFEFDHEKLKINTRIASYFPMKLTSNSGFNNVNIIKSLISIKYELVSASIK